MAKFKGSKSRENWRIGECIRYKCLSRGARCDRCIRFSLFIAAKPEKRDDADDMMDMNP